MKRRAEWPRSFARTTDVMWADDWGRLYVQLAQIRTASGRDMEIRLIYARLEPWGA